MQSDPKYWFRAKRSGFGWGAPTRWEGWAVFGAFFVLQMAGIRFILPEGQVVFLAFELCAAGLMIAICWLKGEPPKWR